MKPRYRFAEFVLSPSRRQLLRGNEEVPLIPRYFDLLLLLVQKRNAAVSRSEIFDEVWSEVIVSDGALSQAVRILRKSLGDSAREPRFIRTVPRHGYRFVYEGVIEEPDEDLPEGRVASAPDEVALREAMDVLARAELPRTEEEESALRDAAETVHRLARREELARFGDVARAILRDARWDLPEAEAVPLGSLSAIRILLRSRFRRAEALVRKRWTGATVGGAASGLLGGLLGGIVLTLGPGSRATGSLFIALPLVGVVVGALGAFGVGFGLAWAEALIRSHRGWALVLFGAAGGGLVAGIAHFVGRYTIEGLFGRDLSPIGGSFEGIVIGAATGAGYALSTPLAEGGMATPRGRARLRAAVAAGFTCAVACLVLGVTGHHLGAMSLDFMAQSFPGSQVSLDPLARLLGESTPGPWTRGVISSFEGFLFACGVVSGLTYRPRVEV